MLLSHKTTIKFNSNYANIIGHMCYAAYKLWNVCNYERINYKRLGLSEYPDWYYQKKAHKDNLWYKSLPSQTAQEVCNLLDKSWKSFYVLQKNHSIQNPKPPRYKHEAIAITYMQNAIVHESGSDTVRLSLPKSLMKYMKTTYGIGEKYLYLKNKVFQDADAIKQIRIYPADAYGKSDIIVIYDIPDVKLIPDNGHHLSIDLGLHNLMTCYDNAGTSFIIGRKYLDICHKYDKEISRVQSQWGKQQIKKGVMGPKSSKHLKSLYVDKHNAVNDYLHKVTRWISEYCQNSSISVVIIGDITGIRKSNDLGHITNQKLHGLPYHQIYIMLQYKLALYGIRMIMQKEAYTSQCSPNAPAVSAKYARSINRIKRGLYVDGNMLFNADAVGAYNVMRLCESGTLILDKNCLSSPTIIKVAV